MEFKIQIIRDPIDQHHYLIFNDDSMPKQFSVKLISYTVVDDEEKDVASDKVIGFINKEDLKRLVKAS